MKTSLLATALLTASTLLFASLSQAEESPSFVEHTLAMQNSPAQVAQAETLATHSVHEQTHQDS
ncbi:hypothetical protein [Pseudomonas sp. RIT-PI-AD]|uniref:hypothetical protein n=1 Tax=Pseudomonas sp. RIT-PI-AD TaxID=3035294 RepID=UPI0021DACE6D|nr:hypothetical protein [Pseudomonas sp. RIT-PI-AD]